MCFIVGSPLHPDGFHSDAEHVINLGPFHQREETTSLVHWLEKGTPEKCVKRKHSNSPGSMDVLHSDRETSPTGKVYTDLQNVKPIRISPETEPLTSVAELETEKISDDTNAYSSGIFNVGTFSQTGLGTVAPELDLTSGIGLISGLSLPQSGFICPQVFAQASSELQQICKTNLTSNTQISMPNKEPVNVLTSLPQQLTVQCLQPSHSAETTVTIDCQTAKPIVSCNPQLVMSGEVNTSISRRQQKLDIPASLKIVSPDKQKISVASTDDGALKSIILNGHEKMSNLKSLLPDTTKKVNVVKNKDQTFALTNSGQCEIIVNKDMKLAGSKPQISLVSLPTVLISDSDFKSTQYSKSFLHVIEPITTTANTCVKTNTLESKEREKDKTKKTLSSKIKEITERIKKDETSKHNSNHGVEDFVEMEHVESLDVSGRVVVTSASENVSVDAGVIDETSTHSHDGESTKLKGNSNDLNVQEVIYS